MENVCCYVIECQYYQNGYCSADDITIDESGDCLTFEFSEEVQDADSD